MVSHENEVMILLGITAVIVLVSISSFTNLPTWITIAVVVVVGVLILQFISRGTVRDDSNRRVLSADSEFI